MSDLLLDQYTRLLDSLPDDDPWPALNASGFLDVLRPEAEGGAGLTLEELLPLALETGARPQAPMILEAMAARLVDPQATGAQDVAAARRADACVQTLTTVLAAGLAAGAIGAIQALSVAHVTTRRQFGREIGRFQAIQQQLAVMAEEVAAARMAAEIAFRGPPREVCARAAALAALRTGQAGEIVSGIAHAVHGAIGVSWEYALHRHVQRLRAWRAAHGGDAAWARQLGTWALAEHADLATLIGRF